MRVSVWVSEEKASSEWEKAFWEEGWEGKDRPHIQKGSYLESCSIFAAVTQEPQEGQKVNIRIRPCLCSITSPSS